jgi:ribonuclease E
MTAAIPVAAAAAPIVVEAAPPAPAPVARPETVPAAPRETFAAPPPPIDLDATLRESGLVMIQTKADRVVEQVEAEEPQSSRPRRERRPPPADLDTPLKQVETTRKSDAEAPPQ